MHILTISPADSTDLPLLGKPQESHSSVVPTIFTPPKAASRRSLEEVIECVVNPWPNTDFTIANISNYGVEHVPPMIPATFPH